MITERFQNWPSKTVGLIWAQGADGEIGLNGRLPWDLPEDLEHFRRVTSGHTVIMGRETWESLPVKPLPGRNNIVVTRQSVPGVTSASSPEEALAEALAEASGIVWVIGGGQIYRSLLPLADVLVITYVAGNFEADTFAPKLGSDWTRTSTTGRLRSGNGQEYSIGTYERR